jgi:diacylglycerol kinase family enzyme
MSTAVIANVDRANAEELREKLPTATWLEAHDPEEVTTSARAAVAKGVDTVVAVGGDGTQRAAAAAVAGTDTTLVPVPAGTVNLLARLLGIGDPAEAVEAAEHGERRPIDVGVADGEVFVLNATTGADAHAIARTSRRVKERFGALAFAVNGLRSMMSTPHHVRVVADGRTIHHGWATAVIVLTNGRRARPGLVLEPAAEFADGLLHVQVVQIRGIGDLGRLVTGVLRRRPDSRVVGRVACREVTISSALPFAVQLDGDARPERRQFTCRVEAGALVVAVPPGADAAVLEDGGGASAAAR